MKQYPHFTDKELEGLQEYFKDRLSQARELAGIPFIITSGKRSPEQNAKAGGVKDSAHEAGLAVDLRATTLEQKRKIKAALRAVGFVRIGTYSGHIHCDLDGSKPQVAWAGGVSHA